MVVAATAEQDIRIKKRRKHDGTWAYTLHHDARIDANFAAVVGDLLFNLRSALDHIAAANRLTQTFKTPFPLFHEPIMLPPADGDPPKYKAYRATWAQVRASTRESVFKVMEAVQPFNASSPLKPADTALAVLNELHNRDKHASLAVVTSGVRDIRCWVHSPSGLIPVRDPKLPPGMFPNNSEIFTDPRELKFLVKGKVGLSIAAGPSGGYRPLPESFGDMADEVEVVLRSIEAVM